MATDPPPDTLQPETGRKMTFMPIAILVGLVLAAGAGWWWWTRTYHPAVVHPGVLFRDGVRSMHEFKNTLDAVRPKVIVPLIDDDELADPTKPEFGDEMALLKGRGIRVERVPIPLGGWPGPGDVKAFLAIVGEKDNQPVLVHCAQGVRRTGMMVAAYQMSVLGKSRQEAKAAVLTFGHSRRSIGDIERFIDVYDPTTREMKEKLEMSSE